MIYFIWFCTITPACYDVIFLVGEPNSFGSDWFVCITHRAPLPAERGGGEIHSSEKQDTQIRKNCKAFTENMPEVISCSRFTMLQ